MKIVRIESRENRNVKHARKVRDGKISDSIFVEGLRLAKEVLRSDVKIRDAFFTDDFSENSADLLREIKNANLFEVPDKILASISDTKTPQGIILICEKPPTGKELLEKSFSENFPLVVMLHKINNPGNLGAILRTCEAVGVSGVIITENSADAFSTKSLRGSMGAAFRLSLWTNAGFETVLSWAKNKKLVSICADVNSETSFWSVDWKKPRLLIFGSEAHGLSEKERNPVDESLIIPMENNVESLNLAVSCAVILFEAKKNRS